MSEHANSSLSTFSQTVIPYSFVEDDRSLAQNKPCIKLPPAPAYISPTYEEESALFESSTAPRVRLREVSSVFNIAGTASEARKNIDISSNRDFPEDEARVESEDLFDRIIRVCMPPNDSIDVTAAVEEEQQSYNTTPIPLVRLPTVASGIKVEDIRANVRQAMSISSQQDVPEKEARDVIEEQLFDKEIRVRFPRCEAETVEQAAPSTSEDSEEIVTEVTPDTSAASGELGFVSPQPSTCKLDPVVVEAVSQQQGELSTPSSRRYPNSKLNAAALSFVPATTGALSALSAEAPEFVPAKHDASAAPTFSFNAEAQEFVPAPSLGVSVQPQVLGYTVAGADFIPFTTHALNPEAPAFYPQDPNKTVLNPEAPEFVPQYDFEEATSKSDSALYLQNARVNMPGIGITTPAVDLPPQQTEDLRQQWITEQLWQYGLVNFDEGLAAHHFSYLGQPVMCKTETPPATSLAIICGKSKLKESFCPTGSDLHQQAMLYNASHLLDPVVYHGDRNLVYDLKGSQLENAVVGQVYKAYSGNGCWKQDRYDGYDDIPVTDLLDVHKYDDDESYYNATDRVNYLTRDALKAEEGTVNEAKRKKAKRENFVKVKSRMSQMMTFADCRDDDIGNKNVVAEQESAPVGATVGYPAVIPDVDVQLESDAESIDTIHPELVVSPLKKYKALKPVTEQLDDELTISPLKPRKASDESKSSTDATFTGIRKSSAETTDRSRESTPPTSGSDYARPDPSSLLAGTSSSHIGQDDQTEDTTSVLLPVATQPPSSQELVVFSKRKTVSCIGKQSVRPEFNQTAAALRTKSKPEAGVPANPFGSMNVRFNRYLVPDYTPLDPFPTIGFTSVPRLPRSPECNNLRGAVQRPHLVRANSRRMVVLPPSPPVIQEESPLTPPISQEDPKKIVIRFTPPIPQPESKKRKRPGLEIERIPKITYHEPHQLSPIAEESPEKEFSLHESRDIEQIGSVNEPEDEAPASVQEPSSPTSRPSLKLRLRRCTTSITGWTVPREHENIPPNAVAATTNTPATEAPHTPPQSPVYTESPIKRPAAPTPSRMHRVPEPQSEDEEEFTYQSDAEELDDFPSISTAGDGLVIEPPPYSAAMGSDSLIHSPEGKGKQRDFTLWKDGEKIPVFEPLPNPPSIGLLMACATPKDFEGLDTPPSPSPVPKVVRRVEKRVSSGVWLSGKAMRGLPTPPDSDSDTTPRPITPNTPEDEAEPTTPQQHVVSAVLRPTPASQIGLAVPYHPPQPTPVKPLTSLVSASGILFTSPAAAQLGSSVQLYFNHNTPSEASPTTSIMERVFKDFSGFQVVARDLQEYPADFAEAVKGDMTANVASPTQTRLDEARSLSPISTARSTTSTSSTSSILSNETVIRTFAHAKAQETTSPSARDVLFARIRRADGSVRPNLRLSSWGKVENKLRKKSVGSGAIQGREVKKGRLAMWIDKVFGRGKQ